MLGTILRIFPQLYFDHLLIFLKSSHFDESTQPMGVLTIFFLQNHNTLLIVFLPSRQIESKALKIENMTQDIGPIVTWDSRCLDSRLM